MILFQDTERQHVEPHIHPLKCRRWQLVLQYQGHQGVLLHRQPVEQCSLSATFLDRYVCSYQILADQEQSNVHDWTVARPDATWCDLKEMHEGEPVVGPTHRSGHQVKCPRLKPSLFA